jgi:uncharacterized protein (DUF2236 family)
VTPQSAAAELFVPPGSVVREIWGDADAILLVFAGAAAEFALNRAVDWLFFTGAIPSDPIGRLFQTASYAQQIVFASHASATQTLARIRAAHAAVERARGGEIPQWAHRDVLYLLIDYSERAHALLRRQLTPAEREDLYDVFRRVGEGLEIRDLPATYSGWRVDRERHLRRDLVFSAHTAALYARYRTHLGPWRFRLLRTLQSLLVPPPVAELLSLSDGQLLRPALPAYRAFRQLRLASLVRLALLPRPMRAAGRGLWAARALFGTASVSGGSRR